MPQTCFPSPLIAQLPSSTANSLLPTVLMIAALLGVLLIAVMVLMVVLKQIRLSRELLHTERLRAIEAGLDWQERGLAKHEGQFMHNAFWISFWMVVVGCGASFSSVASWLDDHDGIDSIVAIAAWSSAALASVAAVTCATILMGKSRIASNPSESSGHRHEPS